MKILVVDDNEAAREAISYMIEQMGHEALRANDGMEAWQMYHSDEISIIISDLVMPRVDGISLCKALHFNYGGKNPHFVLITGKNTQQANYDAALEAGVDAFLHKPPSYRSLAFEIQRGDQSNPLERAA